MEAAESLFKCLEQVADPRRARGVRHPFPAILRLTLLGLVCGQTTMAHIALFARMHWPMLKEPLGFVRDHPPHATTISRTLAGVSHEQLQGALTGWVAQVVAEQELSASVDGKWAKQSEDANGNPLVMVNVLAHDLKLCLAQWPASEKRYEPGVLREQLAQLFEGYPGLRLLTMDALYAERGLCQAIVGHGRATWCESRGTSRRRWRHWQMCQGRRQDYEYRREGTRNLFLACEPLAGWRQVTVTQRRTMRDFAHQMRWLVDQAYPDISVIPGGPGQSEPPSPGIAVRDLPG